MRPWPRTPSRRLLSRPGGESEALKLGGRSSRGWCEAFGPGRAGADGHRSHGGSARNQPDRSNEGRGNPVVARAARGFAPYSYRMPCGPFPQWGADWLVCSSGWLSSYPYGGCSWWWQCCSPGGGGPDRRRPQASTTMAVSGHSSWQRPQALQSSILEAKRWSSSVSMTPKGQT